MCPEVDSASKNEYQDIPGGKDGRCVRVTTLPPSCAECLKFWSLNLPEPQRPLRPVVGLLYFTFTGCILLPCDMYKPSLRHIHDPVLLSLKVEVICFVLSCFPPSLPLFCIPRPHTCIGSESRLSLREGSTGQAWMQ